VADPVPNTTPLNKGKIPKTTTPLNKGKITNEIDKKKKT
jgi:hypothetical protein